MHAVESISSKIFAMSCFVAGDDLMFEMISSHLLFISSHVEDLRMMVPFSPPKLSLTPRRPSSSEERRCWPSPRWQ